jgi:cytochrome c oxidase subunit IV
MTDTDLAHDLHDDNHVSERQYWGVFVLLAAITAIEVLWSYLGFEGAALVLPLVVLMVVKFLFVAGVFMHLFFDLRILNGRWFSWAFGAGLILAICVFFAVIATFHFQI